MQGDQHLFLRFGEGDGRFRSSLRFTSSLRRGGVRERLQEYTGLCLIVQLQGLITGQLIASASNSTCTLMQSACKSQSPCEFQ